VTIPDRRTVLRSGLAAAALGAVGAATGRVRSGNA
jgi:hypothetical protein